jgi:SH3-like domain-containing protein
MIRRFLFAATTLCWLFAASAPRAATTMTNSSVSTTTVHHVAGKTVATTRSTTKTTKAGKTTVSHTVTKTASKVGKGGAVVHVTQASRTKTVTVKTASTRGVHRRAPVRAVVQAAPKPAPVAVAAVAPKPVLPPPGPAKGTDSGLPLPRFAALRSDQVSLRAGPGTRYPIDWVYQRRYLPVKIEREFEVWRLVSQPDGTKGWVHEAMLTGRRGFLIDGDQPQTLRASASDTAEAVAVLKPGVVGRLLSCPAGTAWCQVEAKTYKGWLPRTGFYGTLPDEAVAAP